MSSIQGDPRMMFYIQKEVEFFLELRKMVQKELTGDENKLNLLQDLLPWLHEKINNITEY